MAQKGVVATQYSMGPIDELGLLKIDFLGLSNLTTIKNALRIIKRVYDDHIDIESVPFRSTTPRPTSFSSAATQLGCSSSNRPA
jgi:DNA polymerase III alpha subunit